MEETEVASETTPEQELPDQGETLEGKDKALHDTKAELTRKSQELAEVQRKMAELEGKVSMLAPAKAAEQAPEDPFSFLDDGEYKEKFFDSPDNPIAALKKIVTVFGGAMVENNRRIKEELEAVRRSSLPKDELLEELKADPNFAGLDDRALAKIAENRRSAAGEKRDLPGRVGGSRVVPKSGLRAEDEREVNKFFKKIYGD